MLLLFVVWEWNDDDYYYYLVVIKLAENLWLTLWWSLLHPVPDRDKPSFVIFDIRALWRSESELSVRAPGCQKLQMTDGLILLYRGVSGVWWGRWVSATRYRSGTTRPRLPQGDDGSTSVERRHRQTARWVERWVTSRVDPRSRSVSSCPIHTATGRPWTDDSSLELSSVMSSTRSPPPDTRHSIHVIIVYKCLSLIG